MPVKSVVTMNPDGSQSSVLLNQAANVLEREFKSAELEAIIQDLIDTMNASPAPGIAAPQIGVDKSTLVTGMLGITWSGLENTTLGFESTRGAFLDAPNDLLFPVDATSFAFRVSRTFLRETLRFDGAGTTVGWRGQYGWLARMETTYELTDAMKIALMYVHYGTGDDDELGPFMAFGEHDQVLAKLRWAFTAF